MNNSKNKKCRRQPTGGTAGITLIELVVAIAIISILLSLSLNGVQSIRESMRRTDCTDRLRQIALAQHNYHSAFSILPMHGGGTAEKSGARLISEQSSNHHRLAYSVAVLPFIEQDALWQKVSNPLKVSQNFSFPSMGPVPWYNVRPDKPSEYAPWREGPSIFRCPSDATVSGVSGAINYAACVGDGIKEVGTAFNRPQHGFQGDANPVTYDDASKRGMFANWKAFSFRDCVDGSSNTLILGEICVGSGGGELRSTAAERVPGIILDPSKCTLIEDEHGRVSGRYRRVDRGSRWADAGLVFSSFNTVLPPNSPTCTQIISRPIYSDWFGGVMSSSSYHPGGANMAFLDGSIRFISESINSSRAGSSASSVFSGNPENPPGSKSPYGVWGAMGTRSSND
ncbi:DUF1559 domain-containing protein [Roseiconus lacunae]|uniref:DUF1559 domain-containing protein n=1 Tax=Roseiconus lacunae TaxID=2605694 RepID=UPI001E282CD4|nr:DUF1559 domain-containing protein [Roseiconus lacunae]MCD0458826.1 DUF1559 domain-containing protein [Roseiconus lacunae]